MKEPDVSRRRGEAMLIAFEPTAHEPIIKELHSLDIMFVVTFVGAGP